MSPQERERVAITAIDASRGESVHQYPEFLPDGKHFLYVVQRVDPSTRRSESELVVQELGSKERKLLLRAASRTVYAPPGYLFYVWNGDLLAHPFDAEKLELRGDPQVVARHVQYLADASTGIFSVSQEGLLAYAEGGTIGLSQLTVFDRAGKALGNAAPTGNYWTPRISPDGRRVAAEVIDPVSSNRDIWIFDAAGREAPARISFDPGEDYTPVFSRDGKRIAYASYRKGFWSINQKILGSSEEERPIATAEPAGASSAFEQTRDFALPRSRFLTDWSPDGRFIAFNGSNAKTEDDMWLLEVETQTVKLLLSTPSTERDTAFSPDGRWIAYLSSETGRPEIYVAGFPGPGGRRQVSTAGGRQPKWRADGKELFYLDLGGQLMAVPIRIERRLRDRHAAASLPHLFAPHQHPPVRRLPRRPEIPGQHDRHRESLHPRHPRPELGAREEMTISAGSRLGPYEVLSSLGAGGMGEVYRARDSRLDRSVAIKVLPEEFFEDRDRVARFEREAKALAALNHPGIAAVHSFEAIEGRHILVMELVEGESLDARIAAGALPLEEALPIARQIAEALEAAHEKGIIHRDLKPANVMVALRWKGQAPRLRIGEGSGRRRRGGRFVIVDALADDHGHATAAGVILGTAAYMSPEQARGKTVGPPLRHLGLRRRALRATGRQAPFRGRNRLRCPRQRPSTGDRLRLAAPRDSAGDRPASAPVPGARSAEPPAGCRRRAPGDRGRAALPRGLRGDAPRPLRAETKPAIPLLLPWLAAALLAGLVAYLLLGARPPRARPPKARSIFPSPCRRPWPSLRISRRRARCSRSPPTEGASRSAAGAVTRAESSSAISAGRIRSR